MSGAMLVESDRRSGGRSAGATMATGLRLVGVLAVTLLVCGCSFRSRPELRDEDFGPVGDPIRAIVMLDMSREFTEFEYLASFESREFRYEFGPPAAESIQRLVQSNFASVGADVDGSQLVISPRFTQVGSYVKPFDLGVQVGIILEIRNKRGQKIELIGKGEGHAGIYFSGPVAQAGKNALLASLRDLEEKIRLRRPEIERLVGTRD